jgi:flagellar secretion chaperone FliS
MYTQQRPTAYQDNEVLSAPKERLIPMLYQGLLKNLRRAGMQIGAGDLEGKGESLQKASAIVYELLGSLDFEAGGEIASRLAGLYAYFLREIMEAGRSLDRKRLDTLSEMIGTLHDAWDQAAQQVLGKRSQGGSGA